MRNAVLIGGFFVCLVLLAAEVAGRAHIRRERRRILELQSRRRHPTR